MEPSKKIDLKTLIGTLNYCQDFAIKGVNPLGERTACFIGSRGELTLYLWEIEFVDWSVKEVYCHSNNIIIIDCADPTAKWCPGEAERFKKMFDEYIANINRIQASRKEVSHAKHSCKGR